ncbi:MAG TPA: hypothetical protein VGH76_23415 [Actinomycetospora sp.]|jgi:hypothetical protein
MRGAAVEPTGDLVEADVAREAVDNVVDALRGLGLGDDGGGCWSASSSR